MIAHDISRSKLGTGCPISVRPDDPVFKMKEIPFPCLGTSCNHQTHYLDLSMVYGATQQETLSLRTMQNGLLKTTGKNAPFKFVTFSGGGWVAPQIMTQTFVVGDVRTNDQTTLQVFTVLFELEHNRRAQILKQKNPTWSDSMLFQETRKRMIALWQKIVYYDWLPRVLIKPLSPYRGYKPCVDVSLDVFFQSAAFRMAHSQIPMALRSMEAAGDVQLNNNINTPTAFLDGNKMETVLKAMLGVPSEQRNPRYSPLLQFFNPGPMDIGSFDIQRGRNAGLKTYNEYRRFYGLEEAKNISTAFFERKSIPMLKEVYHDVNKIEAIIGAQAEISDHETGPLFDAEIRNQFQRLRDGDRFYFESMTFGLSNEELKEIKHFTFRDMILLNTDIKNLPKNVFEAMNMPHDEARKFF